MSMVNARSVSLLLITLALSVCQVVQSVDTAVAVEVIVLRSGNAAPGNPDPFINVLVGSGGAPLSTAPFTPADFDSACAGRSAMVVLQPHPAWAQQLVCDPAAQWIGIDALATPASALYCYTFDVETCCIEQATLNFCWTADDNIGDLLYGGPNPDGVYLNGVAVSPSITGGNYATETQAVADVTSLLHCGSNHLAVYNRDAGFLVSGVMFSATIEIISGGASATSISNWSTIKSLYR